MFSTLLNNSKQFNVFKWRSFYYLCMEKTYCLLGTEQREKLSNLSKNIPWTWCAFWMIVLCSWEQLLMDFFRFQTLCQNYIDSNNNKKKTWAGQMAQWVKAFTAKSDDLKLTLMMHMKEGDYQFPFTALWLPNTCYSVSAHLYTLTHTHTTTTTKNKNNQCDYIFKNLKILYHCIISEKPEWVQVRVWFINRMHIFLSLKLLFSNILLINRTKI